MAIEKRCPLCWSGCIEKNCAWYIAETGTCAVCAIGRMASGMTAETPDAERKKPDWPAWPNSGNTAQETESDSHGHPWEP